jgi:RNA polymerase sigma factor (sigma-70 family)
MAEGGGTQRSHRARPAGAGEAEWLEAWMHRWADPLTRFAQALTGSADGAQELVQETFVRLLVLHRQRPLAPISPGWLFTVTRNQHRQQWRSATRQRAALSATATLPTPVDLDRQVDVFNALDRVPPRDRECLWLFYYADLSVREVADVLGISEQAVRTRLHRARERFSRIWRNDHHG